MGGRARAMLHFGAPGVTEPENFAAAMTRMRKSRAQISAADSAEYFRELGADVFLGEGRFTDRDRLEVGGSVLRFRRAVIATGGRPADRPNR